MCFLLIYVSPLERCAARLLILNWVRGSCCCRNWSTYISYQIKEWQIFSHSSDFFHFLVSGFDMGILTKITFFYIPEFVVLGWSLWYILNYYCNVILLAWMQEVSRTFPLRWILYFDRVRALLFSSLPLPLILPDSCPASHAMCMCYLKHPYKT